MSNLPGFAAEIGGFLYRFITHRILWLMVLTAVLFYILLVRMFQLQIVYHDSFRLPPPRTAQVTQTIPALRGTIYDRHGRPLAINKPTFVLKMDPSVAISNDALLELALLFERNGEQYVDALPISRDYPREFTITGNNPDTVTRLERRWKHDMAVPNHMYATAEEAWQYLRERQFNIDPELSDEDAHRIMNFRSQIFMQRLLNWDTYSPTPIIFAYNVSQATIAAIDEQNDFFTGLFVDIQTLREYPAGRYMSHMLGHVLPITAAQLEENEHLGYTAQDMFGRAGLELSMEHFLRGQPGLQSFDVNAAGRRISNPVRVIEPQPGNRVFLTIDLELQMQAFHVLEHHLSQAVIARLTRGGRADPIVPLETAFISLVEAHNLDIRSILEAEPDSLAYPMRRYIIDRYPEATMARASIDTSREFIVEGIRARRISPAKVMLTMIGTGQLSDPNYEISTILRTQPGRARDILVRKIEAREITPQMLALDPFSGSVIITCVHTGQVLAAVTYPSFDNNRFVNNQDNEYIHRVTVLDPTGPLMNRPFREARAPGSTFKMFTAVAGLEAGVIAPTTRISTRARFTAAGTPGVRCWAGGHGSIPVSTAIAVSCNFFFADVAFRLGNAGRGETLQGIRTLNKYMDFFGLNGFTGVEIGEHPIELRNAGFTGNTMAGPEFKRFQYELLRPASPESSRNWFDGDTSQVSIGQGFNNYTAAQMVRGMAVIANRGVDFPLHLVQMVEDYRGGTVMQNRPAPVETDIVVADSTWDIVIEGMRLVTQPGVGGTATGLFRGFPLSIAGKTGTAEQDPRRLSHSSFGAFAPLNDPQIAIYVAMPFGSTPAYSQIAARIAQDMLGIALGLHHEPERPPQVNGSPAAWGLNR